MYYVEEFTTLADDVRSAVINVRIFELKLSALPIRQLFDGSSRRMGGLCQCVVPEMSLRRLVE